jgi:hypothetical protein
MTAGHPEGLPEFFVDRSLGRRQVPDLLRAAGVRLRTLAEVYGIPADEAVEDVDWLAHAGAQGWTVLMKDERIRYRAAEREALLAHNVQAFRLNRGDLRAAEMAETYIRVLPRIVVACQEPGPFLYLNGRFSPVD